MSLHATLLSDRTRTNAFLRAIQRVVGRGDVVVEIGTGTALLAMAAVRAGARHVYAIESGPIVRVAARVIEANEMSDRITLIRGWSQDVRLPEKGDVLVCELIGHEPFGERLLGVTADAVRRLLKPQATSVPVSIKVLALPIAIPRSEHGKLRFASDVVRKWEASYGFNLGPLTNINPRHLIRYFFDPFQLRNWRTLTPPILLFDLRCMDFQGERIQTTKTVTATHSGRLAGIAVYFELTLTRHGTEKLSAHPRAVKKHNHWLNPVWVLNEPIPIPAGQRFTITYGYSVGSNDTACRIDF